MVYSNGTWRTAPNYRNWRLTYQILLSRQEFFTSKALNTATLGGPLHRDVWDRDFQHNHRPPIALISNTQFFHQLNSIGSKLVNFLIHRKNMNDQSSHYEKDVSIFHAVLSIWYWVWMFFGVIVIRNNVDFLNMFHLNPQRILIYWLVTFYREAFLWSLYSKRSWWSLYFSHFDMLLSIYSNSLSINLVTRVHWLNVWIEYS